jgi:hypothetical protein
MNGKYAVAISGNVVVWDNGKFTSDNKELEKQLRSIENREKLKPYMTVSLDGSLLYSGEWRRPSENWALSFGFLQDLSGGDLEFITGDRPTWEKLGHKSKENEIN